MTQKVKAFASKIENLSLIPKTHVMEGETRLPKGVLQSSDLSPATPKINKYNCEKKNLTVVFIPEPVLGNVWSHMSGLESRRLQYQEDVQMTPNVLLLRNLRLHDLYPICLTSQKWAFLDYTLAALFFYLPKRSCRDQGPCPTAGP